jgi:regulatory subunit for Cdc7p protein kinase
VVTHVVTARTIPTDSPTSDTSSSKSGSHSAGITDDQPRTINPLLLDKHSVIQAQNFPLKAQSGASGRREGMAAMDVLSRGRQMGMKIWALEKLQRIMVSMLEYDASGGHNARATTTTASIVKLRDEDLSQVLRNEKLNGPSDRDLATSTKDLTLFKGPFIYIHDMDAKTRPIMVREYPKVARRQDGTWPQFRSAPPGKCPFIDDPAPKKEAEKEKERERAVAAQQAREAQQAQQVQQAPRTRSAVLCQEAHMNPPRRSPRKALKEVYNVPAPGPGFKDIVPKSHAFEAPRALPQMSFAAKQDAANGFIKPQYMHLAREPAASGIQQSNLTSAIRSQMISSTAAAPGAKAGLSKEVNELKRKVLERTNTGSLSVGSIPSSHRMNDLAGVLKNARAPAPPRAAKSKAQEKLGGIAEEATLSEDELAAEETTNAPIKKKRAARKDPKPGYCENCRDKYDDFDDVRAGPEPLLM